MHTLGPGQHLTSRERYRAAGQPTPPQLLSVTKQMLRVTHRLSRPSGSAEGGSKPCTRCRKERRISPAGKEKWLTEKKPRDTTVRAGNYDELQKTLAHSKGASAQKDAVSLLYIISQHETRGRKHAGHWVPGLSAASRLSQLHLGIGNWEARRLRAPCLSSQTGPLWNSKVSGKEARCHWSHMESQIQIVCSYSFFPAHFGLAKGGAYGALPLKGAASFPGMAVTTSRTVADLGVQDGVGLAQSDTQQVSSGKGKKQDQS